MNENNINVQGGNIKQGNSSLGIAALILTLLGCTFLRQQKELYLRLNLLWKGKLKKLHIILKLL